MRKRWSVSLLVLVACTACGGGGGGDGNVERVIATLPVSYSFATQPSLDPYPFCFANLTCSEIVQQDQSGVALTLAQVGLSTTPGEQPIVGPAQDLAFGFFAQRLTDDMEDPLAATFMVGGQAPGCIDAMEGDLVLQEPRPVPGVDLVGFEITGVSLDIQTVSRTAGSLSMTGRVLIYGRTASAP